MRALLRRPHIHRRGYVKRHQAQAPPPADTTLAGVDVEAHRVRAAGGPTDEACYVCACGYIFAAPVSASVSCPRCGSEQAW